MRTAIAWGIGIASFIGLFVLTSLISKVINVPIEVFSIKEEDGVLTTFGFASNIICIMLASRIGMAISAKSWKGNVEPKNEIRFQAWLTGLSIYAVIGILLFLASRGVDNSIANFLFNIIGLVSAAGIAWAMKTWHDQRIAGLEKPTDKV